MRFLRGLTRFNSTYLTVSIFSLVRNMTNTWKYRVFILKNPEDLLDDELEVFKQTNKQTKNPKLKENIHLGVEYTDFVSAVLTGCTTLDKSLKLASP